MPMILRRCGRPARHLLSTLALLAAAGAPAAGYAEAGARSDAAAGGDLYATLCKGCHEVSIAPSLRGLIGRPVAGVSSFAGYSDALKARRDRTWTEAELDRFLASPGDLVPGTFMTQEVADVRQRADLIAYLATLQASEPPTAADVHAAPASPDAARGPVTVATRRLTESEYRHTIADVLGPDIEVSARFEPETREHGLLAIGNAALSLTSSGFEQYFALARAIADQALDETRRARTVGCAPTGDAEADRACAAGFVTEYGERLLRRPLTEAERRVRLETAMAGAAASNDFYTSLKLALTSLLVAPEFLFRVETAEPDPDASGRYRLDGYTKAARLSFLFWDTTPDRELLEAAGNGALHTQEELERQLKRLIASPRYQQGGRAFFSDMLQLDGFDNLIKDPAIYPKFDQSVAQSAREQMLKTVVDLLVTRSRDYRDLFTSNETYIDRPLASVYQVAYPSTEPWARYTFPASLERAGILTHIGFLSLFAHPGTSSPTRRGIKIHEIFMCEPTPDPPADVDFSRVTDSQKGTVRGRLLDHMENPGCAACHRRSDPPGLALEHFDGLGQLRRYENGLLIDVRAELNGVVFEGARGLGALLRDDPRVPACLVRNVHAYAAGRVPAAVETDFLTVQTERFAAGGYRLPELMRQMAASPGFFRVVVPEGVQTERTPASSHDTAQTSR